MTASCPQRAWKWWIKEKTADEGLGLVIFGYSFDYEVQPGMCRLVLCFLFASKKRMTALA